MNQSPQRERKHSEFSKISTFGNFVLFGKFANFVVYGYITYENYYNFLLKNGYNFAHNTNIYKIRNVLEQPLSQDILPPTSAKMHSTWPRPVT